MGLQFTLVWQTRLPKWVEAPGGNWVLGIHKKPIRERHNIGIANVTPLPKRVKVPGWGWILGINKNQLENGPILVQITQLLLSIRWILIINKTQLKKAPY